MSWTPQVTVTIGGTDFTGSTLETVRVTRGRTEVYEEPRAGYVICELIDLAGTGLGIQPLQPMSVSIKNSIGTPVPVFAGQVSDTASVLYDTGFESGTPGAIVTVIAVGPLARLNRRAVAAAGLPQQGDGDRVAALLEEGLAATWEETGGTWATVATPTTTWATFDPGFDLDLIDQPGVFTVAALPAEVSGYNALSQASIAALSGRGIISDTPTGFVAYADGDHRRNAATTDGYLNIPSSALNSAPLTVTSTQADITNRAIVEFEGGTVIFTDEDSLFDYGLLANQFQTILANSSQAETWALDYLEDHSRPIEKVSGVAIRLDGVADALRDDLLGIDINTPVQLLNLPTTLGVRNFPAFVEGMDWRLNRDTATLILNVSDAALSIGSTQWNNVNPTLAWEDVSATLTWLNASEVTA
jgi:hypothetical protein